MRASRILSFAAAIFVLIAASFVVYAWRPALPVAQVQKAASFDQSLIAKGSELSLIGNCNTCHTKDGGAPYAGGRPIPTPFGTVFATNITPDPETGIGRWSEEAFSRAMLEGVRRDGAHLYPAFPYDHFTKLSAEDVRAIYAFLMTRDAARAETPANDLVFPFNIRALIAGWKLLFFERGEFRPDAAQTTEWNRGAYLVEGLAHCGACHTPRNMLGAEKRDRLFSGGESEGWYAPALKAASPAPTPWSVEQLVTYLRDGFVEPHGVAAGPMRPVVNNLHRVSEPDVKAIAAYLGAILGPATADRQGNTERIRARIERQISARADRRFETIGGAAPGPKAGTDERSANATGSVIYAGACAVCHEPTGQRFSAHGIHLAFSKVLAMPDPRNLIHVVRNGIEPPDGAPAALMPGFGEAFTDQQVVMLVGYLRTNVADRPAWDDVEGAVRKIRQAEGG